MYVISLSWLVVVTKKNKRSVDYARIGTIAVSPRATCLQHHNLQHSVITVLISNFRRVVNVVCFLLGNSDAGELPRKKHTTILM
jgi:hypothetical protein